MADHSPKEPRNYSLSSRRKVFPLEDDFQTNEKNIKKVINADFNAVDSEEKDNIIEAARNLDPYLHPKNQVILRALIKINSLIRDIGNLKQYKPANAESQGIVKSLTFKEGLEIAREMGPYLSPNTRNQVESVFEKINSVSHLKNNINKVQNAENNDIKIDYILEGVKPFVAFDKYNQIKQIVNVVKLLQVAQSTDSEAQNSTTDNEDDNQLNDIIGLLDKFNEKKAE